MMDNICVCELKVTDQTSTFCMSSLLTLIDHFLTLLSELCCNTLPPPKKKTSRMFV